MSAGNPVRGATPAPSTSTSVRNRENRPAAPILDLGHPHLLNRVDDVARHRDVVEYLRHLAALGVSPVEEFQHFAAATGSLGCLCMRTKVALVIGQVSAPDSLVRMTPKPGAASQLALRAAAVNDSIVGATALPSLFISLVVES